MSTPKITVLVNFPLDFQEQLYHVKKRGEPLSQYIRNLVLNDREQELSREKQEHKPVAPVVYHNILIIEAVKNNLPGFCGGFISSIMLNNLLAGVIRSEQRALIYMLGYISHPALPLNRTPYPVLPDNGCPRLYVHKDSDARNIATPGEVAKRYTDANHQAGAKVSTPHQMINRIKRAIGDGRPGFCGGFLSIPHVQEFLKYDLQEKDIQHICVRLGYHKNSNDLLVKDGNPDESLEHYTTANTFVNHTLPLMPQPDASWRGLDK